MGNYNYQQHRVIMGTRSGTTLTGATLVTAYSTTQLYADIKTKGMSKINFNFRYTMGAAETSNTMEIQISTSPIADVENPATGTWFPIVNESVSGGTSTLTQREFTITGTNGSTHDFSLPIDCWDEWMRIQVKESGVASNAGNVFCEYTISGEK